MSQDSDSTYYDNKKKEIEFFDESIARRTRDGRIAENADIRRATIVIPKKNNSDEPIEPKMTEILYGGYRKQYLEYVSHKTNGCVLELCCGPGWLALELGRRGQNVDAYDISPQAICCAKRMLHENPYKQGFGTVNYYNEDYYKIKHSYNKYNSVSCWASWYYLANFTDLSEHVWKTLKKDGVFAIEDDRVARPFEKFLVRMLNIILPTHGRTYFDKIIAIFKSIRKKKIQDRVSKSIICPSAKKRKDISEDIGHIFNNRFTVIMDVKFNAFSIEAMRNVKGPNAFRYGIGYILAFIDNKLCQYNICKGRNRIIIARKFTQKLVKKSIE